jgi:hypothetical protein
MLAARKHVGNGGNRRTLAKSCHSENDPEADIGVTSYHRKTAPQEVPRLL